MHIPDSTSATSSPPTHLVFVEALSSLSSDSDPDWTTMSAALLVLRVVDAWAQAGAVTEEELALRVATITPVVDAVDDDELRIALRTLIVAVGQRDDVGAVESRLLVFGRTLEALKIDPHRVIEHAQHFEFEPGVTHGLLGQVQHVDRALPDGAVAPRRWLMRRCIACHFRCPRNRRSLSG